MRSIGPTSREQVTEIVMRIVEGKMNEGQLDDSGLTLKDIRTIQATLVEMLQAVYHPRIDYQRVGGATRRFRRRQRVCRRAAGRAPNRSQWPPSRRRTWR